MPSANLLPVAGKYFATFTSASSSLSYLSHLNRTPQSTSELPAKLIPPITAIHLIQLSSRSKQMRILTRYILRDVTSPALLGGALFTFLIFTRDLGKILEFVVRDSASYSDVARIIAYTIPPTLNVTIPMAVLVG